MKIAHTADMAFVERNNPRGGAFLYKPLFEGQSGSKGNFLLSISRTFADFVSPRHRHNFDQIRVQLAGESSFARDGDMLPGTIGYFPEGTFYGPQSAAGEATVMVLQFGGASGNGYMAEGELQQSVAQLKQVGEFAGGVYRRLEGDGRKQQDAYEAAWENWNGRRLEYPKQRYHAPVMMYPEAFDWVPSPGDDRLAAKLLGRFSERGTEVSLIRIERGGSTVIGGNRLVYVMSGTGRAGDDALMPESALYVEAGEETRIGTGDAIEFLMIALPQFD